MILIANWHVPYVYMLAKAVNDTILVVSYRGLKNIGRDWQFQYRYMPPNIVHMAIDHEGVLPVLRQFDIRLVVLQNPQDMFLSKMFNCPKLYLFHNSLETESRGMNKATVREAVIKQLTGIEPVFISQKKAESWGCKNATVILPGIDTAEFPGGYNGEVPVALSICSNYIARDFMNGFRATTEIARNIKLQILGEGNNLNTENVRSGITENQSHLLSFYRRHRFYICSNVQEFEDGYNLSSLEAMAMGMPILSVSNDTSPIRDGVSGYQGNVEYLQQRAQELIADRALAQELGARARQTVTDNYPFQRFAFAWQKLVRDMAK